MIPKQAAIGGDTTEGQTTVRQNGRLYHTPSFSDDGIGFRLAHDSSDRVLRGGSWFYSAQFARVASRRSSDPTLRGGVVGFRLAFDREGT